MPKSPLLSVEISMYPLVADYIPPIDKFLTKLHQVEGLKVRTNQMSTQVFGPSQLLFSTLQRLVEDAYAGGNQYSFVMKVLNGDVSENHVPGFKDE